MNNDLKIWDYLYSRLNNAYGVAGLMGNLYVESRLDSCLLEGSYARKLGMSSAEYTTAVDNGSYTKEQFVNDHAGYGLAQWTYWSRKEALYDFAKNRGTSIGDLDMQLDYLWDELQKYKTVINTLYSAKSVREASDVVVLKYEKPSHTTEEYLQNRANYGQKYFDEFGGDDVKTASEVDNLLSQWKQQGLKKEEVVVRLANACLGWAYVFGSRGEYCNPKNRQRFYNSQKKETIKTKCKNFEGSGACGGCKWYPNGVTRFFDCRGFTWWCFIKGANIEIKGAGATSQYNDDSNWSEKGLIANMPKDKVCCVFRYDDKTKKMEHTLIYDGQGNYIHDSGEVKKTAMSKYNATHYAIPKGLYDGGDIPVATTATVHADTGSTVNMRSQPSTSSSIVVRVPVGAEVDVISKDTDWSNIRYNGKTGYMKNVFLIFHDSPDPSGDVIAVKKSDLETIYNMIGAMLGK